MNTNATTGHESIDKRTIRAATESMSIDRHAGGPGEYDVYAESGQVYRVSLLEETCACPDEEHNQPADGCKHQRRVEMETGQREIPESIATGRTDVENMIRARERTSGQPNPKQVATDGGVSVENGAVDAQSDESGSEITRHVEPPSQALPGEAPATYYRCEACGREAMRKSDLTSKYHRAECDAR